MRESNEYLVDSFFNIQKNIKKHKTNASQNVYTIYHSYISKNGYIFILVSNKIYDLDI